MLKKPRLYLFAVLLATTTTALMAAPVTLTWRGDITTANSIVKDVAHAWQRQGEQPLKLEPFNTVSGIDAVLQGKADLAGSARGPAKKRPQEQNLDFVPVAWGTLAIITNHNNPVSNISIEQLHDVYMGKITNWSQLGGNNLPIHVYAVASPTDGIEFSLRELLFGHGNQPVAAPRLYLDVNKLQQAIALDPQGFGVSILSNIHGKANIKALNIDHVAASVANTKSGKYKLVAPLYLVTHKQPQNKANAAKVQQFVKFTQSDTNQKILRSHQLIPYTELEISPRKATKPLLSRRKAEPKQRSRAPQPVNKPAAPRVQTYTVVSGDTLSKIARQQHVSVNDIRRWNQLSSDTIQIGQKLKIEK